MKKQVLLYNVTDKKRALDIRRVLLPLKVKVKTVTTDEFIHPLGYLLCLDDFEASTNESSSTPFEDEMLVMAGFANTDVDQLIYAFRKGKVNRIDLKAVLTSENQTWDSYKLYENLKEEHKQLSSKK